VVALVPRFTTEEAAEMLVVAGVFWASRLISLIPPGCKPRNVIPVLMTTSFPLCTLGMALASPRLRSP